jgi:predicted RNA-binding protein
MCETNAYILKNGEEELIMENVALLRPKKGALHLRDLFGKEKTVSGEIEEIRFLDRKILINSERN